MQLLHTCVTLDGCLAVDVADVGCHARGARNIVESQLADVWGQLQIAGATGAAMINGTIQRDQTTLKLTILLRQ